VRASIFAIFAIFATGEEKKLNDSTSAVSAIGVSHIPR
jgi:hypothetical protein